jgi:glycosyltransferase involved in cell wall biosynthesis
VFSPPAERNGAGRLDVLSVGRLVPFKGQGLLIEALAALAERGIDVRATVVGWGETQPGLESLAAKLGVADRVTFTGALGQDEIRRHLDAADVFCLPSFAEGVPVSLMEAMAMELPVVSSRIMGIPELVEDGVSGKLIAPGNVEELTAALAGLAGDPAERYRLGKAGRRQVIEHYAIDRSTAQLHSLFNERLAA